MKAGVPVVMWSAVISVSFRDVLPLNFQAEVEHLDEIVLEAHPAHVDVGRLDVPVHEAARVRIGE
jgi:hypothetical protein